MMTANNSQTAAFSAIITLAIVLFTGSCAVAPVISSSNQAESVAVDFSKFRGVGFIDKLGPGWFPPCKYRETDFQFARDAGFNFVRLPVDYRFLTQDGDATQLDETKLAELDEAIGWGQQYHQHICLALFAVPGYSINTPKQTPSLWKDAQCQKLFVAYWRSLAERYRSVPAEALSFNLLNEPAWEVSEAEYAPVMRCAIEAIRVVDANRPILVDGLKAGREPVMSLAGLAGVGQAMHFYEPHCFTHYRAHWVPPNSHLASPEKWPLPRVTHHLLGPDQGNHSSLKLRGPFPQDARIEFLLNTFSGSPDAPVTLMLSADGREVDSREIRPDESKSEWQQGRLMEGGNLKEYPVNSSVAFSVPNGIRQLELKVSVGDRVTFREIHLAAGSRKTDVAVLRPTTVVWEPQVSEIAYVVGKGFEVRGTYDRQWLDTEALAAWKPLLQRGVPVMVQEFGCNAKVPQAAALPYLEDCLRTWNAHGLGWALYSLRGDMGFVDSKRSDTETASMADGSTLDVQTLRVLKRHLNVTQPKPDFRQ
jgi:hypothetical protein